MVTCGHPSRMWPLQWGRDQVIAEWRLAATRVVPLPILQWGREQVIAEWGHFDLNETSIRALNGAAIR